MKFNNLSLYLILFVLSALFFCTHFLRAQTTNNSLDQHKTDARLSGSDLTSTDAAAKADAIFVGKVLFINFGSLKAKGQSVFRGVQVQVTQILFGTVDKQVTLTLRIQGTVSSREAPPNVGGDYIFFVMKGVTPGGDKLSAIKVLDGSDDNIKKVRDLIASMPKPQ